MIKKVLILTILFALTSSQGFCLQLQESQLAKISKNGNTKVYNQYGSLVNTYKNQSNGDVRVYDKYGSYQGRYKQTGSNRVKFYTK